MNQLFQLEQTAVCRRVDDAIIHLRQARNAFRKALRVDARGANRQLSITEALRLCNAMQLNLVKIIRHHRALTHSIHICRFSEVLRGKTE